MKMKMNTSTSSTSTIMSTITSSCTITTSRSLVTTVLELILLSLLMMHGVDSSILTESTGILEPDGNEILFHNHQKRGTTTYTHLMDHLDATPESTTPTPITAPTTPTTPITAITAITAKIAPMTTTTTTTTTTPTTTPTTNTTTPISNSLLPLNDVNILVVTDTHGWVAGHGRHEPHLDADYGHVLSFYQRLKHKTAASASAPSDTWFVQNGDFVHGTLLGDDPPHYLIPILQKMPFDLLNLGNHDIQQSSTVQEIIRPGSYVDRWGPALLTSNTLHAATGQPIGNRYRILNGRRANLLAFGFLYNLKHSDHSPLVTVQRVEDVIQSDWFLSVLQNTTAYDAILVMAHMGNRDRAALRILDKIRSIVGPHVKIQFITGHTHKRQQSYLDDNAFSFEPGRYLDTLGFVSFGVNNPKQDHFDFRFIDASHNTFQQYLQMKNYITMEGVELQDFIRSTSEAIGANKIVGCSPQQYRIDGYLNQTDSLLRLYMEEVLPATFLQPVKGRVVMIHEIDEFVKYDLFPGNITMNDVYGVLPQDDTIVKIATQITGKEIQQLAYHLHGGHTFMNGTAYRVAYMTDDTKALVETQTYELYTLTKQALRALSFIDNDKKVDDSVHGLTVRALWLEFFKWKWRWEQQQHCVHSSSNNNNNNTFDILYSAISQQGPVQYGEIIKPTDPPIQESASSSPTVNPTAAPSTVIIPNSQQTPGGNSAPSSNTGETKQTQTQTVTDTTTTTTKAIDDPSSNLSTRSIGGIASIVVGTVLVLVFAVVQARYSRQERQIQMIRLGTGSLKPYQYIRRTPSSNQNSEKKSLVGGIV